MVQWQFYQLLLFLRQDLTVKVRLTFNLHIILKLWVCVLMPSTSNSYYK